METFSFQQTSIEGLVQITPFFVSDERGYFSKSFEQSIFSAYGIDLYPWEEFRSCSKRGVLRGLHFQRCHSQDKLVQVLQGTLFDVAVDLRESSPTFGKWEGFELSAENRRMLYIPKGFAHGFLALEESTLFSYLCGDRYDPESDGGIRWDDPDLSICWPLKRVEKVIVSTKDAALPTLAEALSTYRPLFT